MQGSSLRRRAQRLVQDGLLHVNGFYHGMRLGEAARPCRIHPRAKFAGRRDRIRIGAHTEIQAHAYIDAGSERDGRVTIGAHGEIHDYSRIVSLGGRIVMGDYCSLNPFSIIYGSGGVTIGSMVRIAAHVVIVSANHGIDALDAPIFHQPLVEAPIVIGDDVWIGAGARILAGVTIHSGAVIGAGSVVTADVPQYAVALGVPARVRRYRHQPVSG